MSDNTQLNVGTGGDYVRDLDRNGNGVKTGVMQIDVGGPTPNTESLVSATNPMPVSVLGSVVIAESSSLTVDTGAPGQPLNVNVINAGVPITEGGNGSITVDTGFKGFFQESNLANAQSSDSPVFTAIAGDPSGDFAGVNLIEAMMDGQTGLNLHVNVDNQPTRDAQGSLILSDAQAAARDTSNFALGVGQTKVIDTTGYQSLNITTQLLAGTVTTTNDMKTFSSLTGTPAILGAYVTAITAGASFSFPVVARYIIITATTAGTATYYLRQTPWNANYTTSVPTGTPTAPTLNAANVSQWAGTGLVNAGLAGVPAVGGNIAPGVAPTTNPLVIGGVDITGLVRRAITDALGNQVVVGSVNPSTNPVILRDAPASETAMSLYASNLKIIELLTSIAWYLKELPVAINSGVNFADEPSKFADDQTLYAQ